MKWPYTTAEDYLQYVVRTQFPHAQSIELKDVQTYDKLPDAMRQYADKYGQILLRNFQQGLANSVMGSSFTQIRGAKADAAAIGCVIKLELLHPRREDALRHNAHHRPPSMERT